MNIALLSAPEVWFHLGVFRWLWSRVFTVSAHCGLGNLFGGDKEQNTINTEVANSYNTSNSQVDSLSDSGNVAFTLGGAAAAGAASTFLPWILGGVIVLAAVFLLTSRR